jgi:GAF domain-containing protein
LTAIGKGKQEMSAASKETGTELLKDPPSRKGVSNTQDIADADIADADIRTFQRQLLRGVLRVAAIVGLLVVLAGSYDAYIYQSWWTCGMYWAAYGLVLLFLFWRGAPYALQAWVVVGLVYVIGVSDFVEDGTGGSARVFMLIMPFLAGVFLGRRASITTLVLATLTMAGFGAAFSTGLLVVTENPSAAEPGRWIAGTLALLFLGVLIVVSLNFLIPRLTDTLYRTRTLVLELEEQRGQLEHQVAERTVDLARRGAQLETAAQVARDAVAIRDVEVLLVETARLISERFGFYHTGIFLLDEASEYAVLRAASSDGGQRMLARGHQLKVGEVGIVGYVARQGEPRVALDVGKDAVFFDNPDLPETRSEVALPLRVRRQVIGVLDVQSTEPNAFSQEDVAVLQTLADQVAVAISNARLFQRAQESLEAERRAYEELTRMAWQDLIQSQPGLGQRYDPQGILSAEGQWRQEMKRAVQEGRAIPGQNGSAATLAIPLKVREQVIGVLDAHKPAGTGDWTEEEVALLQTLVDQLAVALDGARLYRDTQRRAVQDRVVGQVATRMRESLDVDRVLETAADELYSALGLDKVVIRLAPEEDGSSVGQREPGNV